VILIKEGVSSLGLADAPPAAADGRTEVKAHAIAQGAGQSRICYKNFFFGVHIGRHLGCMEIMSHNTAFWTFANHSGSANVCS